MHKISTASKSEDADRHVAHFRMCHSNVPHHSQAILLSNCLERFLLNKYPNRRFYTSDLGRSLPIGKRHHWRTNLLAGIQKHRIGGTLIERGCSASCFRVPETIACINFNGPVEGKLSSVTPGREQLVARRFTGRANPWSAGDK